MKSETQRHHSYNSMNIGNINTSISSIHTWTHIGHRFALETFQTRGKGTNLPSPNRLGHKSKHCRQILEMIWKQLFVPISVGCKCYGNIGSMDTQTSSQTHGHMLDIGLHQPCVIHRKNVPVTKSKKLPPSSFTSWTTDKSTFVGFWSKFTLIFLGFPDTERLVSSSLSFLGFRFF